MLPFKELARPLDMAFAHDSALDHDCIDAEYVDLLDGMSHGLDCYHEDERMRKFPKGRIIDLYA